MVIQPTIQVQSMRFQQQGLPLRNGTRDDIILSKPQRLLLHNMRESRDAAAAAGLSTVGSGGARQPPGSTAAGNAGAGGLRKGASHHMRNNSEGAVPVAGLTVGPMMQLLPQSPVKGAAGPAAVPAAAAAGVTMPPSPLHSIPSGVPLSAAGGGEAGALAGTEGMPSPVKHGGAAGGSLGRSGGSAAAAAASAGGSLALSSQPVIELVVRNASERYFRLVCRLVYYTFIKKHFFVLTFTCTMLRLYAPYASWAGSSTEASIYIASAPYLL